MTSKKPSLGHDTHGEKPIVKAIVTNVSRNANRSAGTWILLCEAAEGGWGFYGMAFGREGFAELAARAKAVKQRTPLSAKGIQDG